MLVVFVVGQFRLTPFCTLKVKGNVNHAPQDSVGGCSSPSSRPWARRWRTTNVCDAWPVRRQTYGYLSSRKTSTVSPPIVWYQIILLGDRGTCVNNLPRVALDIEAAGIWTRDLLIASPACYRYATKPHNIQILHFTDSSFHFDNRRVYCPFQTERILPLSIIFIRAAWLADNYCRWSSIRQTNTRLHWLDGNLLGLVRFIKAI